MEHQNTPEEKPDDSDTRPSRSRHRWGDPATSIFLEQLIDRPWLVWLGVGSFLLLTIYISLFSIFQPITFRDEVSQPTSTVTTPPHPSSQTSSSLPLWLLAGATLGGVVGSVAIARKLPSSQLSQLYQRLQSASTRAIARRQRRKLLQHQQVLSLPPVALKPVVAQPPLESQLLDAPLAIEENFYPQESPCLKAELTEQSLVEETMKILIVLDEQPDLAPEEKQVANTESLAEMLDIRKKLPLSAILGDLK